MTGKGPSAPTEIGRPAFAACGQNAHVQSPSHGLPSGQRRTDVLLLRDFSLKDSPCGGHFTTRKNAKISLTGGETLMYAFFVTICTSGASKSSGAKFVI